MLRNYLLTALRNLERNRLYGAISILGLAVAFTAALLIAQFVRQEFSYDRWLPGYQQVYKVAEVIREPGQAPSTTDLAPAGVAGRLRAQFPGATGVARLQEDTSTPIRARSGYPSVRERGFAWADPDIFRVLDLPVLAGDLQSSLQRPDTIVITRRMARRYFGRDLPIGQTLEVQAIEPQPRGSAPPTNIPWHAMRVTAVLRDLPSNTNLTTEMFASDRSAYSAMSFVDRSPPGYISNFTFVRLTPKATADDLQRALVTAGQVDAKAFFAGVGGQLLFHAVPLGELHLTAFDDTAEVVNPVGNRANAYTLLAVAALIVLVAAINFVTLLTARATRRATEVGVRKATGARRADLMIQFIGEALIQVALSTAIALALAELLIGPFGAFAQRGLRLDYLHDPVLLAGIVGAALVVGLLAAVYPAFVLSSFHPAAVLKGGSLQIAGSATARQALVLVQFAVLVGLIVTTATFYRQTEFALARGFGGGADSGKIVGVIGGCDDMAFPDEVRRLPGVSAAACSSLNALNTPYLKNGTTVQLSGGRQETFDIAPVDFGFLELYGLKPLAGRLFSRDHGEDGVLAERNAATQPTVVLNEAAAHRMGFSDPRAVVGQTLLWPNYATPGQPTMKPSRIIGVIPDMPLTVRTATDPFVYYVSPYRLRVLSVKLTGQDIPGTVRGIDQAWKRTGHTAPIQETFVSQFRIGLYLDLIIQGTAVAICAVLAILIACLGLFALAAYTTERRTKEIGVRKVMGADTRDVVLLLLWQFTMPVLAATAIAIPIGFVAMDWWLRGFAYHVDLPAWTFVLAAVAAVAIAWLTVSWQSFTVARAKPASALRYE
jgi:putative ABC transport system permease protein